MEAIGGEHEKVEGWAPNVESQCFNLEFLHHFGISCRDKPGCLNLRFDFFDCINTKILLITSTVLNTQNAINVK